MATFPRTNRLTRGYHVQQVEEFFEQARAAWQELHEDEQGTAAADRSARTLSLTADDIRAVSFDLARHGYAVGDVDAALDRLEDAVTRHERDTVVARRGHDVLVEDIAARSRTIVARLDRPAGERFERERGSSRGYSSVEVDAVCERLDGYFRHDRALSVDEVRRAVFRPRRGRRAYREVAVDAFLARAVEVMVAAD